MERRDNSQTRRGSIVVIAALLAVALVVWAVLQLARPVADDAGLVAKVTANGEVVATLPLSADTRYVVETAEGVNTVVVQDGGVHIEDADCTGGDCMKQGTIHDPGRILVCLPHKVIVEVVAEGSDVSAPSEYTGNEQVGQVEDPDFDTVAR